eukprot:TRINITY_DN15733_c0_g1_i2.p1 TRINITY_DN15733_c0_g1~~TRINITY_DN15733_c0_g1_i2.p1  ORF type:complete len:389 (-),score=56.61 TRINITY_DN15733_c0_g1_i2:119-1285(-)
MATSCVRDPVAAEAFFASLPDGGRLSSEESRLLSAFLSLADAARALRLPRGVSLQEWAERRLGARAEDIEAVNASGLVFVSHRAGATGASFAAPPQKFAPPRSSEVPELGLGIEGSRPQPASDGKASSMVRSWFSGVKSLGAGILGAVIRPLKRSSEKNCALASSQQNTFYYDEVQKRWRERGDNDTVPECFSDLDPMTGRPRMPPAVSAPPAGPPPLGQASNATRMGMSALSSLYVNPLQTSAGTLPSAVGNAANHWQAPQAVDNVASQWQDGGPPATCNVANQWQGGVAPPPMAAASSVGNHWQGSSVGESPAIGGVCAHWQAEAPLASGGVSHQWQVGAPPAVSNQWQGAGPGWNESQFPVAQETTSMAALANGLAGQCLRRDCG